MRIVRYIARAVIIFLTLIVCGSVTQSSSLLMFMAAAMTCFFGLWLPRHGPNELVRILSAVAGLTAATFVLFLKRSFNSDLPFDQDFYFGVGTVAWLFWTLNDRGESDPLFSEILSQWFGQRWVGVVVAFCVFAGGLATMSSLGNYRPDPFDVDVVTLDDIRRWAIVVPFLGFGVGLLTSRGGRNRPFLTWTAAAFGILSLPLIAYFSPDLAYRDWRRPFVPIDDLRPQLMIAALLWTFLPLWLLLWSSDWMDCFYPNLQNPSPPSAPPTVVGEDQPSSEPEGSPSKSVSSIC